MPQGKGTTRLVPVLGKKCMTVPGVIQGCKYPAPVAPKTHWVVMARKFSYTVHTSRRSRCVGCPLSAASIKGAMQREGGQVARRINLLTVIS